MLYLLEIRRYADDFAYLVGCYESVDQMNLSRLKMWPFVEEPQEFYFASYEVEV